MRIGFLGPARGASASLQEAAEFLVDEHRATKLVYLASDSAFDEAIAMWAQTLVGGEPYRAARWHAAAELALGGASPEALLAFVEAERQRDRLRALERLPEHEARCVEFMAGKMAVLAGDKSYVQSTDFRNADIILYGESAAPLLRRVGSRVFLTPGPLGQRGSGVMLCVEGEPGDNSLNVTAMDAEGHVSFSERLEFSPHGGRNTRPSGPPAEAAATANEPHS